MEGQATIAIDIDVAGACQTSSRTTSAWGGVSYLVPSNDPLVTFLAQCGPIPPTAVVGRRGLTNRRRSSLKSEVLPRHDPRTALAHEHTRSIRPSIYAQTPRAL